MLNDLSIRRLGYIRDIERQIAATDRTARPEYYRSLVDLLAEQKVILFDSLSSMKPEDKVACFDMLREAIDESHPSGQ